MIRHTLTYEQQKEVHNEIMKELSATAPNTRNERPGDDQLFEMTYKRKDYKEKLVSIAPQIVQNWCLIRYGVKTGRRKYLKHWSDELYGHMKSFARYQLKNNNSFENRKKAIYEVWDGEGYKSELKSVDYTIDTKFEEECIPTNTETYFSVCQEFLDESDKIIDVLASDDKMIVKQYVDDLIDAD